MSWREWLGLTGEPIYIEPYEEAPGRLVLKHSCGHESASYAIDPRNDKRVCLKCHQRS